MNKIPSKTIVIYEWNDIKEAICESMNIKPEYFRDYQKVVGGEYKDLWHVALKFCIPNSMANDTIVQLYTIDDEFAIEDGEEWQQPFFDAYNIVIESISPDDNGVYVNFSW